jgi:hypothetical protein
MSEIDVRDENPWYLRHEESRYLQVWCGNAYLLVRKADGYTTIGYQDEQTYLPTATHHEIADWVKIFGWRAKLEVPNA